MERVTNSLDWVAEFLKIVYIHTAGTYYHVDGDLFLSFLSLLLKISSEVRQRRAHVQGEGWGTFFFAMEVDSLSMAARVLAAVAVDDRPSRNFEPLFSMQREDGS